MKVHWLCIGACQVLLSSRCLVLRFSGILFIVSQNETLNMKLQPVSTYIGLSRYANCWGRLLAGGGQTNLGQLTMTQVPFYALNLFEFLFQILFGGIFSQLFVAPLLVAPLERVKVLLQVNMEWQAQKIIGCQSHWLLQDYIISGTPWQVHRAD